MDLSPLTFVNKEREKKKKRFSEWVGSNYGIDFAALDAQKRKCLALFVLLLLLLVPFSPPKRARNGCCIQHGGGGVA